MPKPLGTAAGALFCVAGLVVCILGVNGNIDWVVQSGGFSSNLKNAGPGVVFAVIGGFMLWRYRPRYDFLHDVEVLEPNTKSGKIDRWRFERDIGVPESKKGPNPRRLMDDTWIAERMRAMLADDAGPEGATSGWSIEKPRPPHDGEPGNGTK